VPSPALHHQPKIVESINLRETVLHLVVHRVADTEVHHQEEGPMLEVGAVVQMTTHTHPAKTTQDQDHHQGEVEVDLIHVLDLLLDPRHEDEEHRPEAHPEGGGEVQALVHTVAIVEVGVGREAGLEVEVDTVGVGE
jgi:hypothetical protein